MTPTDLDLLEEKAKKATPDCDRISQVGSHVDWGRNNKVTVTGLALDGRLRDISDFIASASPTTVLELIRMVRCTREGFKQICHENMDPRGPAEGAMEIAKAALKEMERGK